MTRSRVPLVGLLLLALALPASAQEPGRTLNGHDFLPSNTVDAPFAISYFSSITGGGLAFGVKTPFINTDGETLGTLEGNVAFMALGFGYQHRFGDWFAARAKISGGGRIGADEQTMLAQGVTGTFAATLGGTARIMQTKKFILSGGLDWSRTELVGLNAYDFAQRVIDNGGLDPEENALVSSGNAHSTRISALAGWAPYDWLGVHGFLDGGWVSVLESDAQALAGGGLAVGVDLKNLELFPLGVQLVGRNNAFSTAGSDLANRFWSWGLAVFYTGWDDFSAGFEVTRNYLERRSEGDDFESMLATFNLRYWP